MNCPQCQKQMKERRFLVIDTLFGGLHLLEVLLALLIVPAMMAGLIGMAGIIGGSILSVLIIFVVVAFCWKMRWYRCTECHYTALEKVKF